LPPDLALTAPCVAVALALARRSSLPARSKKEEEAREAEKRMTLRRAGQLCQRKREGGKEKK